MNISQDNKSAMRNPWVLGWLALLITVLGVNIAFIVTAFKTTPGLVEESYYEKGRDHEKNFQKKLEARNRLGWDIRLQTPEEIILGKESYYSTNIVDSVGMPLQDAVVTLQAYRPSDSSADIRTEMQNIATGVYQTPLNLHLKGIWDIKIKVRRGEDELEIARRVIVRAP